MKNNNIYLLLFSLIVSFNSVKSQSVQKLFDGKTLKGWNGNTDVFKVKSNTIVGGSTTDAIPKNQFLCTEKVYGDFELTLEAKLTGKGKNAGIQFRTARIPNDHEVSGYQYDMGFMEDRPIWASLYDESRRKKFLIHPPKEDIEKILKTNDWNKVKIRCIGKEINFWLNGKHVMKYIEEESNIAQSGSICLQIHEGEQAEASYKNIVIKKL
jgi:Domain of Unknown Function (DUF1080)